MSLKDTRDQENTNEFSKPLMHNKGIELASADFYIVSQKKLITLSLTTGGIYYWYWFFKNWQVIKRRQNSNLRPIFRTIVAFWYIYELFAKIEESANKQNDKPVSLKKFANLFVFIQVSFNVVSVFTNYIGAIQLYMMIALVNTWILSVVQHQANIACGDKDGLLNSKMDRFNFFTITVSLTFWCVPFFFF